MRPKEVKGGCAEWNGQSCVLMSSYVHLGSGALSRILDEHTAGIGKLIIKRLCANSGHWFHPPLNKCPQYALLFSLVLSGLSHCLIWMLNFFLQLFRSSFGLGFGVLFCCVVWLWGFFLFGLGFLCVFLFVCLWVGVFVCLVWGFVLFFLIIIRKKNHLIKH